MNSTPPAKTSLACAARQALAELQPMPAQRYAQVGAVVHQFLEEFTRRYEEKRLAEMAKGEGLLAKIGNDFYLEMDLEYAAYSTVTRSFDSALGTCLQNLVISLASLTYVVQPGTENKLQNPLSKRQQQAITAMLERGVTAELLEQLADPAARIDADAAAELAASNPKAKEDKSQCDMLVLLPLRNGLVPVALELKFGGMLDDKKAQAEKRGLLEYCARYHNLHGVMPQLALAVLYDVNDRTGKDWSCATVQNAFAPEELLVGRTFWNLVMGASDGYDVFMSFYRPASRQFNAMVKRLVHAFVAQAETMLAEQARQAQAYVPACVQAQVVDMPELFEKLAAGTSVRDAAPAVGG